MQRRSFLQGSLLAFLPSTTPSPWKLGVITDEVDRDLTRTLATFYPKYDLRWAELREIQLDGKISYVYRDASPQQWRAIRQQLDDAGVKVSVVDTAVYKIALPGTQPVGQDSRDLNQASGDYPRQLEDLKRAAEAAHTLGTRKVRIFTFKRVAKPEEIFDRMIAELHKAIEVARANDVILVVENEFDCNVGTGTETSRLFKAIEDRTLMHNWDPGNCIEAGQTPFPDAWNQLDHGRIAHIHLKDSDGHKWLPIGRGDIDFHGQFQALQKIGYSGTMSLETHYVNAAKDRFTSSVESMDGLQQVLNHIG